MRTTMTMTLMSSDDEDDPPPHHHLSSNRIIRSAAFASLFAVILFTIILLMYAIYMLRRRERRRRAILYRLSEPTPQDEASSSEPPRKLGLDPSVVASLPTMAYKSTDQLDPGDVPPECSVCLGTIAEDSMVRVLSNCKHMFHVGCIDVWLGSHTTCPICRTEAESRIQPEETGSGSGVQPSAPFLGDNRSREGAPPERAASGSGS